MRLFQFTLLLLSFYSGLTQEVSTNRVKKIHAASGTDNVEEITIDGILDEDIWNVTSGWSSDFVQYQPNENFAPSEETSFRITYDSKFLYVAVKCLDGNLSQVNSRMSRRDGVQGDWVAIMLDTYHDLRSAFSFTVSAAGVKSDKMISLNGLEEDHAWNPIWYTKTNKSESGWTVEMKIPFSQLRFGDSKEQVWGIQVQRRLFRNEEYSVWQRLPLNAPGLVSEFGELHGLSNLKAQKQLEIQPFTVGSLNTFEKEPQNPYRNEHLKKVNFGLDGKVGVTNDLTLDFTVNPDFGQVEADPGAIALDGFQLFFREQRPFFIENRNIFDYRFSSAIIGGSYSSDNLFYSRRIGRSPQKQLIAGADEYINSPNSTDILGAIKFSGKTKKGLSIGILESVTNHEHAEISNRNGSSNTIIEPLTNYFVGRLQKDFNNKNTFLGGVITTVHRRLEAPLNFLPSSAITGGLDFTHQWNNRKWYFGANLVASNVVGSTTAITTIQNSITHLFQRTDAAHLSMDSTRTSLIGTGGDVKFGKAANGHVKFESGLTWRSPELELNDLGFMREADVIQQYFGITYNSINSFGSFRKASIGYRHWFNWDFAGKLNYIDWDVELTGTFRNNWEGTLGFYSQPHTFSKSLLQGGPRIYLQDQFGGWWSTTSDTRKDLSLGISGWTKTGKEGSLFLIENQISLSYQPIDRLNLSATPRYTIINHRLQFNSSASFREASRYITSMLNQRTMSLAMRINFALTANLSIQYYAEPFITAGTYQNFSFVTNATAQTIESQLNFYEEDQLIYNKEEGFYRVDEDLDGTVDYGFPDPNFSLAQFRSNMVLRYEYKPGSEIFLAWSQGLTDQGRPNGDLFQGLRNQVFEQIMENTLLLKATYRFHR